MKTGNVNTIKEFRLFNGLSDKELKLVSDIARRKNVDAGTAIIVEDETGDDLYLLEEGVVDINKTLTIMTSKYDSGTKERSFIRLTGEQHPYFGEMALFGKGERSATVKAVNECKLLMITSEDFRKLCDSEPRIGFIVVTNIALVLADYLRKTNEDVIKLTTALSLALSGE
ncbi:MAG: cyclic nucleotide-binding domain-containing protein [Candidatus Latescibacteria bacterium]|jgi:CRP/FNR family transcriptional regulator, cyclic AMP receptor protein|nr:cyclic nucleotide-binding domain-containing protein [Candidatus Latescibacterota bacterium]